MFKNGQAAMEFLMTYGWAILVVLAAIGALAYFGVLDIANLLPDRCAFPAGLDCVGKASIDSTIDEVKFVVQNSHGASINLTGGSVTSDECTTPALRFCAGAPCTPTGTNVRITNNQKATILVNCTGGLEAGRFKADVVVNYVDSNTGLTLKAPGQIRGKASA